ncbi:MAG: CpaF family protein [Lachnospiraceae bacterium]|nr:CpaF family protein [Lachnospiraceae bacterium]MEE3460432.1 CpaF family protein [Lachnospiraceae bacterium]
MQDRPEDKQVIHKEDKDDFDNLRKRVLERITSERDISDDKVLTLIEKEAFDYQSQSYMDYDERSELIRRIFNSIRKLDVLQELLEDREITEIMINGYDRIFIEKHGEIIFTGKRFSSPEKLYDCIQTIVSYVNRIVNESSPIVDLRLKDGSRVNVVLPPVSLDGPTVTIRKFPDKPLTMDKLLEIGSLTPEACTFLQKLVRAKYTIMISGGTGSGKTTFLNALAGFIPSDERVITIEDSAELQIRNIPNLVRLETRNKNLEGKNEVTMRDLMKSALRMRPDRIIVGEVRDAAVIEMLTAMSTGHEGSLSTGHANSPGDMMRRIETMYLTGLKIPVDAIRNIIVSSIDIVVQLGRLRDHSRRVLSISEVRGIRDGEIELKDLFEFREETGYSNGRVNGSLKRTGEMLKNTKKLQMAGISL